MKGTNKGKRKVKIIHRGFQLRVIFISLAITILFFGTVVAGLAFYGYHTERKIDSTVHELEKVTEKEDEIVKAFIKLAGSVSGGDIILDSSRVSKHHNENMEKIRDIYPELRGLIERLVIIASVFLGVFILQTVLFYRFLLKTTHRIAGPMYVMEGVLDRVLEGSIPDMRDLRRGDEYNRVYEKLRKAVDMIERDKRKYEKLKARKSSGSDSTDKAGVAGKNNESRETVKKRNSQKTKSNKKGPSQKET